MTGLNPYHLGMMDGGGNGCEDETEDREVTDPANFDATVEVFPAPPT